MSFSRDVVVVGGGGHVGLPLALAFANAGKRVASFDINEATVETVQAGRMPFHEDGADAVLTKVLADSTFEISADSSCVSTAEYVIVVIGTPVDDHNNPDPDAVVDAVRKLVPLLRSGQMVILRSTVFPGVTRRVTQVLQDTVPGVDVAICPERIAQGNAMTELYSLPQIVGADNETATARASNLFSTTTGKIISTSPEEAELAKLFTNTWRYMKFAIANQFFMTANDAGVDFARVQEALMQDYPRAQDMPSPGFAAGPCLLKDTLQLATFEDNKFAIGHAAISVNEGLPLYLVKRIQRNYDLSQMTVGILGMGFKAETDDSRSSLSYKLRKILKFRAKAVLCSDPYVADERLVPQEELLAESDIIIIGVPHAVYRNLEIDVPVVDQWNLLEKGLLI